MGYEMGNQNTNGRQVSEQDTTEATEAANEPSEMSKYVDDLKVSEEGEHHDHDINTKRSHGLAIVVNDAEKKSQSTEIHFSFAVSEEGEHRDHDINTNRSHRHSVVINDAEEKSQLTEIKEEEEDKASVLDKPPENSEVSFESVDPESNEQKPVTEICQESAAKSIKEEIRFQGEGLSTESGVEENAEEEKEQDNASDRSNTEFTPSQQENVLLSNPINSTYLDDVDSEIKRPEENDEKIINLEHEEHNQEDGESEYSLTNLLQTDEITATEDRQQEQHDCNPCSTFKESPAKDVEINTSENQSEIINLKQEEHKREDGGSKDSLTDQLQTDEITATENRHQEQHDNNPNSTSEESNTEKECKEILENRCNISPDNMLDEEKEDEEKTNYKSDWENNKETSQINEEQLYSLTSSLSEPTVALSEQPSNEFASQIIEVHRTTMSEEQLHQTNFVEKGRADSPEPSERTVDLICIPEFEPKKNSEETETSARKVELVTESNDSSEYLNIYSGLLNLANKTFVSESQPVNRIMQGQTSPPVNEKFTQATKVSEVERILDSAKQNQNTKQQCPTTSLADKSSDRRGLLITESNHKKQNIETGGTREIGNLEKLNVEIGASATQSQKEDSGDSPLLVYEFERCVPEAEAQPPNIINKVEAERGKQKLSPDHELTDDISAYEITVIVPESTNEETDKRPLLHKESSGSSGLERTRSRKLKAPIESCLEDVYVLNSFEKNEGLSLTKTTEEVRVLTVERTSKQREKQKPRSSLFSNCMCCTTAIN